MAKEKGKKKKKDQDQPKSSQKLFPRRSMPSTVGRLETCQETHQYQMKRKQTRLKRRCEDLVKLLGSQGEDYYETRQSYMPAGKLHKYLRRMARRKEIIGPLMKRRKSKAEKVRSVDEVHIKEPLNEEGAEI